MSLSGPCRVLQGESIRSCRWTRVPPLQGQRGLFQRCQRSRSLIATKQGTSRYTRVKRASVTQESFPLRGLFIIRSLGRVYLDMLNSSTGLAWCHVIMACQQTSVKWLWSALHRAEIPWEAATCESGKICLGGWWGWADSVGVLSLQ